MGQVNRREDEASGAVAEVVAVAAAVAEMMAEGKYPISFVAASLLLLERNIFFANSINFNYLPYLL